RRRRGDGARGERATDELRAADRGERRRDVAKRAHARLTVATRSALDLSHAPSYCRCVTTSPATRRLACVLVLQAACFDPKEPSGEGTDTQASATMSGGTDSTSAPSTVSGVDTMSSTSGETTDGTTGDAASTGTTGDEALESSTGDEPQIGRASCREREELAARAGT